MAYVERTPAEIEREIDGDRRRIEEKLGAIQERLSPGQMVDEVLGYVKGSGSGDFVNNLGRQLKNNPMPVALMGVSLAWLMASQNSPPSRAAYADDDITAYPLAPVTGTVRRVGQPETENGSTYSRFADDAGRSFRALSDSAGRRAGHFMDDAGKSYRGFSDAAGQQVTAIQDEAGKLLDEASGWASATWRQAKETVSNMGSSIRSGSSSAYSGLQDQSARMTDLISTQFREQPLVAGALAFAVGAALGAALPHTDTEDALMGEAGDKARETLNRKTGDLMDEGERLATDTLHKAAAVASDIQESARESIKTGFAGDQGQSNRV